MANDKVNMTELFKKIPKTNLTNTNNNALATLQNIGQKITSSDHSTLIAENATRRSKLPRSIITHSSLTFISEQDLLSLSVVECTKDCTKDAGNYPVLTNTQNDPRMGTTDSKKLCSTCTRETLECPGHLGRIKLYRPFVNPYALDATKYVLQSVCNSCGKMYLDKDNLIEFGISELTGINRLKAIAKHSIPNNIVCLNKNNPNHKGTTCSPNPEFSSSDKDKERGWDIKCKYIKNGEIKSLPKEPDEILKIFKSISSSDLSLLGFTGEGRPENFIMTYLPVIPEVNRPTIIRDNQLHYDHLTLQYGKIINANEKVEAISKIKPVNENDKNEAIKILYFYIVHLFDNSNSTNQDTIRSDEKLLSIKERLTNKDGLFRNNAMGKRDDYNARSVVGPDNGLMFGEVRYPQSSDVLTVPEKVHARNLDFIRYLFNRDLIKQIIKWDRPVLVSVSEAKSKAKKDGKIFEPVIGDIVYRYGLNGDETLLNRQPTLHKYGMMGVKAIYSNSLYNSKFNLPNYADPASKKNRNLANCLQDSLSIGVPSQMTTGLNMDFDGDEGNKHKPQTLGARAEVRYIVSCTRNFMSDQSSRPIAGLVYSCLVSGDLISQPNVLFTNKQWKDGLVCLLDQNRLKTNKFYQRLERYGVNQLSGRAMFSTLFPPDFYYSDGDLEKGVLIKEGIFISGVLAKKHIGPSSNGIIQSLFKNYDSEIVVRFYTEGQYILDWFLELRGFSIGIGDCIPKTVKKKLELDLMINREISTTEAKVQQLGPETDNMTSLEKEIREKRIQNYLGGMTRIGQDLGKNVLDVDNPLNVMSRSGAKGTAVNTAQIVGVVGQQFIKGQRPALDMSNGTRCLPYFPSNSNSIFARGFVKNSFNEGLEPDELFFHLAASRIGIMDTAIRTAETGYMHHKINKALEDLKIAYDGSVIGGTGAIFQFCYSDGFDAANLVAVNTPATGTIYSPINFVELIGKLNLEADNEDLNDDLLEEEEDLNEEEPEVEIEEEILSFRDPEY